MRGWGATHWLSETAARSRTAAEAVARRPSSCGALPGALPRRLLRLAFACASREMTTAAAAQVARLVAAPTVCATSSHDASDRLVNLSTLRVGAATLSSSSSASSSSSSAPPHSPAVGTCGICAGFSSARFCAGLAAAAAARRVRSAVCFSDEKAKLARQYSPLSPSLLPPYPSLFSYSAAIATSSSSRVAAATGSGETSPPTTGESFVSLDELLQEVRKRQKGRETYDGSCYAILSRILRKKDGGEKSVPYLSPEQFRNVLAAYNEAQPITTTVKTMTVSELKAALSSDDKPFVVDVRSPEEYAQGVLNPPFAVSNLEFTAHYELNYSQSTGQGAGAPVVLCYVHAKKHEPDHIYDQESEGLTNAISVAGGTSGWIQEGFPVKQPPKDITVQQLKDSLASPNPPFVLDVRSPEEYKEGWPKCKGC
ncbi:hypothetical protein CBR_g40762 [Chara braunii]|uniref:Rhodanese domain-containing protein n=1 Tax=Chara braunii TaxID=69332 RepID=A0A388LUF7_CHABU|nr:hypothetical protein CBR_g40762 [Chara braunii]|eukprot:GBG85950.1 hypothetical protein CBR_g40762 [Chara braunii]